MLRQLQNWLDEPVDAIPLAVFRIGFGLLMCYSTLRFISNGWIQEFYVEPIFHFTYLGFDWIAPLPETGMVIVFSLLAGLSLLIATGLFYRVSMISFFLLFTYVELIDKTYYLNHYYFISVMSLLMITLPLNSKWSLDAHLFPSARRDVVSRWTLVAPRLMLGLVYFYAGLAKLNADWLFQALPLRIWLPARADVPLIGWLFDYLPVAYLMSWTGAFYDLTIPFWLSWRKTRFFAYLAVIGFHLMTGILFNIGVFPWVMIACTLVFFDGRDWRWLADRLNQPFEPIPSPPLKRSSTSSLLLLTVSLFFVWQMLMPLRYHLYPGNHLWTNEGYRFAWHVMLVEKSGSITYRIEDPTSERFWIVYPQEYLTRQQEQQMSFQPDMMLQFAHFLAAIYAPRCNCQPDVYADTYVSLNQRPGQPLIDSTVNLASQPVTLWHDEWIIFLSNS